MFNIDVKQPEVRITSSVLVRAISTSLSCYIKDVQNAGIDAIMQINEKSRMIYEKDLVFTYSLLFDLLREFIHCCYKEPFYENNAGLLGIGILVRTITIPLPLLKRLQPEMVACFLFVLKDTIEEAPVNITKDVEDLLLEILRLTCSDVTLETLNSKYLQNSITDVVCELNNPNARVRKACQSCLTVIHESTQIPIVKLMEHSKHFLLSPIFTKPLRALSFTMQIGNIDAMTYCVGLPDSFLTFNEELFRFLQEVIVLADAEDESLSTVQRSTEYKTAEHLVQLRITCIKLMALALKDEKFATAQQGNLRIRVLAVFFKTMLKTSPEIINATYDALKGALEGNSKLPKELLQNGLKPMLMNLSDHQKLSISGLDALSKLAS